MIINCTPKELEKLFHDIHEFESVWEIDGDLFRFFKTHMSEEDQIEWFTYIENRKWNK